MSLKRLLIGGLVVGILLLNRAPATVQAAPAVLRESVLVLVNAQSADYVDFQHYIQPYLDHFGIPYTYTTLDISTTPVTENINEHALIIIGHRNLDSGATPYLDLQEQGYISAAVNDGAGLVNFDNALSADDSTGRYQFITDVFGFGYNSAHSGQDVVFADPGANYIIAKHTAGQTITTQSMNLAGIALPADVTALATTGGQPLVAVTSYGGGRAVQFGSYAWMSHSVKGPLFGLDDLVWRSMVWAARKPFVMQGLPPFVTMRMEDVSGPLWWMSIANDYGIIPWAGIFTNDIDAAEGADLSALVNSGKATATVHAFGTNDFFYYDHENSQPFGDAVMASHYVTATQWFADRNIPIGQYVAPHYFEIGANAFAGLQTWGTRYVGTMMAPGGALATAPWLQAGPFRKYETGPASSTSDNVYYADYLTIPGHPELDQTFFDCATEIRDITGYEWLGNGHNSVPTAIADGAAWLKRALDSMAVATLVSHEYLFVNGMSPADWQQTMAGVTSSIREYKPQYVSQGHACAYARAVHDSDITGGTYDAARGQLSVTLSGQTEMPTQFYVFTEEAGQIVDRLVDVPAFNATTQVTYTLPGPLDHITVAPNLANVAAGATQQFTASGYDANNNPIGGLALTWTVTSGGGTINPAGLFTAGGTPGTYSNTVQAAAGSVTGTASVTVPAPVCPCSIWTDSDTPETSNAYDGRATQSGTKFRSTASGYITGLKFYKGNQNTGTHTGQLYARDGTLLAEAVFTNETPSGWQTVYFAAPVAITAGTTYIASYHSASGYYAVTTNYLTAPVHRPPLTALADGTDGGNGVYRYSPTPAFPTASYAASNYWVDVVFETTVGPDTTPPTVLTVTPANGATTANVDTQVRARFNEALDGATVTGATFELRDTAQALVPSTVSYDAATTTAILAPTNPLNPLAVYTATLKGGAGEITDVAGNALAADYVWSFSTQALPPGEGPGGPILVITSASNPFSRYYAEILRAEGLNAYMTQDISLVTADTLANFDVVILGEMPLTAGQVSLLTSWVNGGGNLIAMRPDGQLAGLLGLTAAGGTRTNAYLGVDTGSGPGAGIVSATVQYHGSADLYTLSGATGVATLYSDATTVTANPAVTLVSVGANGGQAAAFTFDLARSVVYTRQGNPAWPGWSETGSRRSGRTTCFTGMRREIYSRTGWI